MAGKPRDPKEMTVPQKWRRIEVINETIGKLIDERKRLTDEVESAFARIRPIE